MSEVLIKGMEMPKACWECPLKVHLFQQLWCTPSNKVIDREDNTEREPDCPLVEVKVPHGRLGDLDELKSKFRHSEGDNDADSAWISTVRRFITQADTIIEAEGSNT